MKGKGKVPLSQPGMAALEGNCSCCSATSAAHRPVPTAVCMRGGQPEGTAAVLCSGKFLVVLLKSEGC